MTGAAHAADRAGTRTHWVEGLNGYPAKVPVIGKSTVGHELFHALQDMQTGLFSKTGGSLVTRAGRTIATEYSAHLWGGPLVGTPVWTAPVWIPYGGYKVYESVSDD